METRKRYPLSLCLLLVCTLTGCSDLPASGRTDDTVIRLFSGVSVASDPFGGEPVAFAAGSASDTYSEIWQAKAVDGEVTMLPARYYPADNSRIYLRGYYPAVPPTDNGVAFLLNGRQDVLVSNGQSGCLTDMFWQEAKRFTFGHLLTQLNIRLKVANGYPAGATLKSLRLNGSRTKALLNLTTGSLAFSGNTVPLDVWAETSRKALLGTAYPDTLIGPVMAEPGIALGLEVTVGIPGQADRVYPALPIRFGEADGLSVPGTSYTLSVTLSPPGANPESTLLSATVADWVNGSEGIGTIEEK